MKAILSALVATIVGFLLMQSLTLGHARSFDTMLYVRSLWGISHGHPINSVVSVHALAIHGHFALYLLAPLARLVSASTVLVVAQAGALCAALVLAARGASSAVASTGARPRDVRIAGMLAVCCFSIGAPFVVNPFLFDLRPDLLGVPLATAALIRLERMDSLDRWSWLLLAAALACREEFALVGVGAAAALPRPRDAAVFRDHRIWLLATCVGYWGLYWFVLRPAFGGERAAERVGGLPSLLLGDVSAGAALGYKVEIVAVAVLTGGAFSLRAGRWILAFLPGLAFVAVQGRMPESVLTFHYTMFAAPGLIAATIRGLRRTSPTDHRFRRLPWRVLACGVVAFLWSSALPFGGRFEPAAFAFPGSTPPTDDFAVGADLAAARALIQEIPSDLSLAVPMVLGAAGVERARVSLSLRESVLDDHPDVVVITHADLGTWGRELVETRGYRLWGAVPATIAVLHDGKLPPRSLDSLTMRDSSCAAPIAEWPDLGLDLCRVSRFSDGRAAIEVHRRSDPVPRLASALLMFRADFPGGILYFTALRGVFNAAALPVGQSMRLLAGAPRDAFDARLVVTDRGGPSLTPPITISIPTTFRTPE